MENIEKAAGAFNLFPVKMEQITDRVYQIDTGQHQYAIKRSSLGKKAKALPVFEEVYRRAAKHTITSILPVYLTRHAGLYTEQNGQIYYVTPWISDDVNNNEQVIQSIYKSIADTHAKTKKVSHMDTSPVIEKFANYQKRCAAKQNKLLESVELFEQRRYMSPLELQVCTHFHILNDAFAELDRKIGDFNFELGATNKWNVCLCHGNLKSSHILHGDEPYLINWEKASINNAITDLVVFFKHQLCHWYQTSDKLMEHFSVYASRNSLNQAEINLLSLQMLDPQRYITTLDAYLRGSDDTMTSRTIQLESALRQIKFGLYCSKYLEEQYSDLSQADD
ncbi:phosphotransferase [Virgibacillus siamensis]|uniref:phosphotransferase n=1 Tax=Virgibacillus siamensis TaxID=480071 RepID=UPI000986D3A6|nr:phosphotransferase [Virgibacillus siamensis]